jgi:hypothetical protein
MTGKFIRASKSTGIFSVLRRVPLDRTIRVKVFQIIQLEIGGKKGATVGQYLTLKVLENFDVIRVHAKKFRMRPRYGAMFNFYDIQTNGITLIIIDSPMMKPRLISLPSISKSLCTSEHSQLFLHSHKNYHSQLSLLLISSRIRASWSGHEPSMC